jgi:hypothetical protein
LDAPQVIGQRRGHVSVHPGEHVGQLTTRHTGRPPRHRPCRRPHL